MTTIDASSQMLRTVVEAGIKSDDDIWTNEDYVLCFASPSTSAIRAMDSSTLLSYPPFQQYFDEKIITKYLSGTGLKAVLWTNSFQDIIGCVDKTNKCGAYTSFNWRDRMNYRSIDRNDLTFVGNTPDEPTLRRIFEFLIDCRKASTTN